MKKTKQPRPAPKHPGGRPPLLGMPMTRVNLTLDHETVQGLRQLGQGNLSAGVRQAWLQTKN